MWVVGMNTGLKSLWSSCSISPAEQPLINPLVPSFLLLYLRQGFKGLLRAKDNYPTTWAPRWPHCPGLMTKTKKSMAWFLSLRHQINVILTSVLRVAAPRMPRGLCGGRAASGGGSHQHQRDLIIREY